MYSRKKVHTSMIKNTYRRILSLENHIFLAALFNSGSDLRYDPTVEPPQGRNQGAKTAEVSP